MIIQCTECRKWFEDVYRSTACPHKLFHANDSNNNFSIHPAAYLSDTKPSASRVFEAHSPISRRNRSRS